MHIPLVSRVDLLLRSNLPMFEPGVAW